MASFHDDLEEYKQQLEKGSIQRAYRGLMEYIMDLRTYFQKKYPSYFVSGSIYYGYMDMTYFSFFPQSLKDKGLKVAIVFLHQAFRFEVWLAGYNKQVQARYWKLLRETGWSKYRLVTTPKGTDSILESILVDHPDFRDPEALTSQIDQETMKFIGDVENFLSTYAPPTSLT
jgi:Family of unknown function (DUF7000)